MSSNKRVSGSDALIGFRLRNVSDIWYSLAKSRNRLRDEAIVGLGLVVISVDVT